MHPLTEYFLRTILFLSCKFLSHAIISSFLSFLFSPGRGNIVLVSHDRFSDAHRKHFLFHVPCFYGFLKMHTYSTDQMLCLFPVSLSFENQMKRTLLNQMDLLFLNKKEKAKKMRGLRKTVSSSYPYFFKKSTNR